MEVSFCPHGQYQRQMLVAPILLASTPLTPTSYAQYLAPILLETSWSAVVLTQPMCDASTYVDIGDMAVPADEGRGEELFWEGEDAPTLTTIWQQ